MHSDDLIDQYFMRGYGWRAFALPIKAGVLKRNLHQYRNIESVHCVTKGDFSRRELEDMPV